MRARCVRCDRGVTNVRIELGAAWVVTNRIEAHGTSRTQAELLHRRGPRECSLRTRCRRAALPSGERRRIHLDPGRQLPDREGGPFAHPPGSPAPELPPHPRDPHDVHHPAIGSLVRVLNPPEARVGLPCCMFVARRARMACNSKGPDTRFSKRGGGRSAGADSGGRPAGRPGPEDARTGSGPRRPATSPANGGCLRCACVLHPRA
jgi:hypothetical protein